jgi:Protein of unknown function (DUF992)
MRHSLTQLPIVLAAAVCATVSTAASAAERSLVGTLTCIAEVTQNPGVVPHPWKLACAFEPATGKVQHYSGSVADPGPKPRAAGKAFLVWNVFAAMPEVGPGVLAGGMLVGTYKEGRRGGNTLIGGRDQAFLLQPLGEPARQGGVNIASRVSAVRLELPKV